MIQLNKFISNLLFCLCFSPIATFAIDVGLYDLPHEVAVTTHNCHPPKEDAKVPIGPAVDTLEILSVSPDMITFKLDNIGSYYRSCSAEGAAKKVGSEYVAKLNADKASQNFCEFRMQETSSAIQVKIRGEGCSDFCGMNTFFNEEKEEFLLKERNPLSGAWDKLDFKKVTAENVSTWLSSEIFKKQKSQIGNTQKEAFKTTAYALQAKAQAFFKSKKIPRAILNLDMALQLDQELKLSIPNTERAAWLNDLGFFWQKQDDFSEAKTHYEQALKSDSSRHLILLNLGDLYWENKDCDNAEGDSFSMHNVALLNYQDYVKSDLNRAIPKNLSSRCAHCAQYKSFLADSKMDPKLVGKWQLRSLTCPRGKQTLMSLKVSTWLKSQDPKLYYRETIAIEANGQEILEIEYPGKYIRAKGWLLVKGNKILAQREGFIKNWASIKDSFSQKPKETDEPDRLRNYKIDESGRLVFSYNAEDSLDSCDEGELYRTLEKVK